MPQSKSFNGQLCHKERPLLIGITGNIGSGKSTFCNLLALQGLSVYYADTIANQRLEDPAIIKALIQRFSLTIVDNEQSTVFIDRRKLAEIVFSQPQELEYLNSLLHPKVLHDFQEIVDNSSELVLCFEVPLLFEAGLQHCFDYLVLVYAPEKVRLQRLQDRGEQPAKSIQRMRNQLDDLFKREQVDCIVDNNGSPNQLELAANALITSLPKLAKRELIPFS